ncbi:MAG: hypothetical protein AAF726_01890 [Planctomycetota bacterium]
MTYRPLLAALFGAVLAPASLAQTVCTQNADSVTITLFNSIACVSQTSSATLTNAYLRRFTPATSCGQSGAFEVGSVTFGIEMAASASGSQAANVRLYTIAPGANFRYPNMTLLIDEPTSILDSMFAFQTVQLSTAVAVPAGVDLVVELFVPGSGDQFYIGSNANGQSGPTFIASQNCGFQNPQNAANLTANGADMHMILEVGVLSDGGIGTQYCAANPNSSGATGDIRAMGSVFAANNDVTLSASDLPFNSFGYFLASRTQGFTANPAGSQGNLCLSGNVGRYVGPGQIMSSGLSGEISLDLNLSQTPQPTGFVAVMPQETWYFQLWHRDSVGGTATSNFTNGLSIDFQ